MEKKKPRKSVAFEEGDDANGEEVTTAQSHSIGASARPRMSTRPYLLRYGLHLPALSQRLIVQFTGLVDGADADPEVDELAEQLKDLKKKKKKKAPAADANGDDAPAADGEFDPTALTKKKKKKRAPKEAAADSFDAQLAEAGVITRDGDNDEVAEEIKPEDAGDLIAGTGVWNSASTVDLTYPLLLARFFTLLRNQHPDLAGDGRRNYKIPPPQVLREGNKKTIFANISDICKRMKRQDEHVTQFLFAELGTSGSVDGSKRLVIRGKFQQKQLENVLRRYIRKFRKDALSFFGLGLIVRSGVRYLQDLQVTGHRPQEGREPPFLCYLQQLRLQTFRRVRSPRSIFFCVLTC